MTQMACASDIALQEANVIEALTLATSVGTSSNTLFILYGDNEFLTLRRYQDLEETSWKLRALSLNDELIAPLPDTEITLHFASGRVSGSAGCNSFTGSYLLEARSVISITQIAATRMACEGAVMAQETQFIEALNLAASVDIETATLVVNFDENNFLTFDRVFSLEFGSLLIETDAGD